MKNMKKLFSLLLVLSMLAGLCAGCGAKEEAPAEAPAQEAVAAYTPVSDKTFGGAIKYDPTLPVNNGEEITIDYWLWTSDAIWQAVMDAYMEIHPNVHINIINNPWEDYFVKLPVALSGGDGPAMFNMHPGYTDLIVNNMAPYAIPLEDMQADYDGVDSHIIDGNVYFLDIG